MFGNSNDSFLSAAPTGEGFECPMNGIDGGKELLTATRALGEESTTIDIPALGFSNDLHDFSPFFII